MSRCPDVYDQWVQHDRKQQEWLDSLPRCERCNEPIQSDFYYDIYGEIFCEECLEKEFRKWVEE